MPKNSLPNQPNKITFIIGLDIAGWRAGIAKQFDIPDVVGKVKAAWRSVVNAMTPAMPAVGVA